MLLPENEVWVGFNANGVSMAASIEKRKPTTSKMSIMNGCALVLKCKFVREEKIFARHVSTFEVLK